MNRKPLDPSPSNLNITPLDMLAFLVDSSFILVEMEGEQHSMFISSFIFLVSYKNLNSRSIRSNCPAYVSFLASKCGQKLEVISVCNEHNHEVSEEHMKLMPQNRKLDIHIKKEVLEMLQLNIDKKLVLEYIQLKSNKNFTLKDLFNLSGSIKNKKVSSDDGSGYLEMLKKIRNFLSENNKSTEAVESTRKRFKSNEKSQKLFSLNENETVYFEMAGDSFVEYVLPAGDKNIQTLEVTNTVEEPVTYYNPNIENLVNYEVHEIVAGDEFCIENNFDEENNIIENQELFEIDPNYTSSPDDEYVEEVQDEVQENEEFMEDDTKTEHFVEIESDDAQLVEENNSEYTDIVPISPIILKTVKNRNKRLGRRIRSCRSCGTNSRLHKMQLEVMKAEKRKLKEETTILKLKKQKLLFELANLKQCQNVDL